MRDGTELEVKVRLGETELIKEAGSRALGLRVLKDARSAVTYTSDFTPAAMERFARESVELAGCPSPIPRASCPRARRWRARSPISICGTTPVLSLDVAEGLRRARAGRGGRAQAGQADHQLRRGGLRPQRRRLGVRHLGRVLRLGARDVRVVRRRADLRRRRRQEAQRRVLERVAVRRRRSAIPRRSGSRRRAARVAKLGARKIPTGAAPVVFSPEAGRGLVGQLAGVLSGGALVAAQHLPGRSRRDGGRLAALRAGRRSADPARPRLARLRRRRAGQPHQRADLRGRSCERSCATSTRRASWGAARPARPTRAIGGGPHVGISNLILRAGTDAGRASSNASSAGSTSPI